MIVGGTAVPPEFIEPDSVTVSPYLGVVARSRGGLGPLGSSALLLSLYTWAGFARSPPALPLLV